MFPASHQIQIMQVLSKVFEASHQIVQVCHLGKEQSHLPHLSIVHNPIRSCSTKTMYIWTHFWPSPLQKIKAQIKDSLSKGKPQIQAMWSHYRWATSTRNCYTWKYLSKLTSSIKSHLAHARAWLFQKLLPSIELFLTRIWALKQINWKIALHSNLV